MVAAQVWRLLTNFLFFGLFSIDFLFHMYFVYPFSRKPSACICVWCAVW